jgi:hypothetical protein
MAVTEALLPSTFNSNAASLPRRLNLGNFYPRTSCESTISAATAHPRLRGNCKHFRSSSSKHKANCPAWLGYETQSNVDEAAAKRAQGARSDAEYRLNEAKNRAEELEKDIDALTQRREALRSEIDNIKNAPAAAADPVPVAPPQSVFPPRRTESAPVNIAPRVASPAPRPTPRPAPRTPLVPN